MKKIINAAISEDIPVKKSRTAIGMLASVFGMTINLILFAAKLAVGLVFGSISVMADAFNNLSDLGNSIITLLGFKLASRPADKEHPFGHGRMEYMSALVVSVAIILVGLELIRSSVGKIISPELLQTGTAVYIVLSLSIIFKLLMGIVYSKIGKKINSPAVSAAKSDSFSDAAATFAVLISAILIDAFDMNIDAYVGLAVAVMIIITGIKAARDTLDPLLGQPPAEETVNEIRHIALSYDNILDIHSLTVHNYGAGRSFASLHATVPQDMGLVECHEMVDRCEKEIETKLNIHMLIHIDPTGTTDSQTIKIRGAVCEIMHNIDPSLIVRDFRLLKEEKEMLFDIFIPLGKHIDRMALTQEAEEKISSRFDGYAVNINVVCDA